MVLGRTALVATTAAALLLTGCGSNQQNEDAEQRNLSSLPEATSAAEIRPGVSPADCANGGGVRLTQAEWAKFCRPATEGSVSAGPHMWPDGITAKVLSLSPAPDSLGFGPHDPQLDAGVLVTIEFSNEGATALAWAAPDETPDWKLLYGANRYEAESYGYEGGTRLPTQLLPGTSAQWTTVNFLPSLELGTLAFQITPEWNNPAYQPWTFTGVEKLAQIFHRHDHSGGCRGSCPAWR